MIDNNYSTFHGNLISLCEALESFGFDSAELLLDAGLNLAKIRSTNSRVSIDDLDNFIDLCLQKVSTTDLAFAFTNFVHPSTYHALGMSLLSSSSLRSFSLRLQRYFSLISTIEVIDLDLESDPISIGSQPKKDYKKTTKHFHSLCVAAVFIKIIRQMYNPTFSPAKIDLIGGVGHELSDDYAKYFGCTINFDSTKTAIYIDKKELDVAMPAANADLTRQLDQLVVQYLESINHYSLTTKVSERIISLLPSGEFGREKIARELKMSPRTFHDKLLKEKTSYQIILDNIRKSLAKQYIEKMDTPITELTYLLGFAEASSFSRAFKKWYGISPKEYQTKLVKVIKAIV